MVRLKTRSALAFTLVAAAAACDRAEVRHFRVAKQPPAPTSPSVTMPAGMARGEVEPPPPPAGGALRWTLPAGWSESRGGPMRFASLKPPVGGRIDGSVVVLPGTAGGDLANVNRWRGQIGLPPLDAAGLAAARKVVRTGAGALDLYDFTSGGTPPTRVVAGLTVRSGSTWFVKLTGDAEAVRQAHADFMKLLGSLHFE
jgi:hypothetical protein